MFVTVPVGLASRVEVSTAEEQEGVVAETVGDALRQLVGFSSRRGSYEAKPGGELFEFFIAELLERHGWLVDDFASGVRRVLTGTGQGDELVAPAAGVWGAGAWCLVLAILTFRKRVSIRMRRR